MISDIQIELYATGLEPIAKWWNFKNLQSPYTRIIIPAQKGAYIKKGRHRVEMKPGHIYCIPNNHMADYFCPDTSLQYYIILNVFAPQRNCIFTQYEHTLESPIPSHMIDLMDELVTLLPNSALQKMDPYIPAPKRLSNFYPYQDPTTTASDSLKMQGIIKILLSFIVTQKVMEQKFIPPKWNRLLSYIENNIQELFTLESLASIVDLETSYFSCRFKEIIGENVIEYIQKRKIRHAQLLLLSSDKSIKEVAHEIGFSDSAYFCRIFKKISGETAKQYRVKNANI